jgi:hypothetical protein
MAEGDEPRVICEFSDYDELINGLRARAAELNLSGETIDAVSGLASRYSAKLLARTRSADWAQLLLDRS